VLSEDSTTHNSDSLINQISCENSVFFPSWVSRGCWVTYSSKVSC